MSTTRDFDRLMEAYFEEGPTVAADRVLEAIRDDVERIDVRADRGSWRNTIMLRPMIAAAAVVTVLLGGLAIYTAINQPPNVGPPNDSSAPLPSGDGLSELPAELQYSWVGPPKPIPGVAESDRGDLSYESSIWRFELRPGTSFWSTPRITQDGELRMTTGVRSLCEVGDAGTYPWSLAQGGTLLTIEPGTDDCEARAAAMPGTYQRAACPGDGYCLGELEAGQYVSHVFEPRPLRPGPFRHGAMRFTVPAGWASYVDAPDAYGLTPQSDYAAFDGEGCYDCSGERNTIAVLSNPGAATEDCGEEQNVPGVGFAAQDLVDWLVGHPGLVATAPEAVSVGGLAALSLTIEAAADWTGTCDEANPFVAVPVFHRLGGYHWALGVGGRYEITLVDLGDGNTVAIVVDSADDAGLEAFAATARPIIESMEFPPR